MIDRRTKAQKHRDFILLFDDSQALETVHMAMLTLVAHGAVRTTPTPQEVLDELM